MKKKVYQTNTKQIIKNIIISLAGMALIIIDIVLLNYASTVSKVKAVRTLMYFKITPLAFLPFYILCMFKLHYEIKALLYSKDVLIIEKDRIIYQPWFYNPITIQKSNIDHIYVASLQSMHGKYIGISLKEEIEIPKQKIVLCKDLIRRKSYDYLVYICASEIQCDNVNVLASEIKDILKIM